MVLPPNRVGGIRGPNGTTLDDLGAVLGFMATTLNEMQLTLEAVATSAAQTRLATERLAGLSGTDSDWPGLPAYLNAVLGGYEGISDGGDPLHTVLLDVVLSISKTNRGLFGTVDPSALDRLSWLLAVRNALIAGQGENVYERLGSVRDNSLALVDAIGALTTTPEGQTVRALLQAQLECCEGGTVPPAEYPPPSGATCGGQPAEWVEASLSLFFDQGAPDQVVYSLIVPSEIGSTGVGYGERVISAGGQQPGITSLVTRDGPLSYTVCVAWNFDAATPLYNMAGAFRAASEGTSLFGYTQFSETPPLVDQVNYTGNLLSSSDVLQFLHVNFAFASGTAPLGKVYVSVTPNTAS